MVQTHAKQAPYRTFVVAAVVPRGYVSPALYWDTPDPYHYCRVQPLDEPLPGMLKGDVLYDAYLPTGVSVHETEAARATPILKRVDKLLKELAAQLQRLEGG